MSDMILVSKRCPWCGLDNGVLVPEEVLKRWEAGVFIQVAWPDSSADDREVLISGSHPACWDEMFSDEDEYDDE